MKHTTYLIQKITWESRWDVPKTNPKPEVLPQDGIYTPLRFTGLEKIEKMQTRSQARLNIEIWGELRVCKVPLLKKNLMTFVHPLCILQTLCHGQCTVHRCAKGKNLVLSLHIFT